MTLIEVMIAILVMMIVILGCATLFSYGMGHISSSKNYRVAAELASQKLEYFRSENFYNKDINDTVPDESIVLDNQTFTRSTEVSDVDDPNTGEILFKDVKVTVQWNDKDKVELATRYVKR